MPALRFTNGAVGTTSAHRALVWLGTLLAVGAALTVLPIAWLAAGLLALIGGTLILVRPQVALYLICFAVPFGSLLSADLSGISVGITDILLAAALVAWFAHTTAYQRLIKWPRLALPVALFVGFTAFSLLYAQSLPLAAKEIAKWVEFLVVMLIVSNLSSQRQSHVLVASLLLAGIAQAALGAYQFLTRSGPEFFAFGRFLRAYGTFEQPNPFGGYVGMVLPLSLALVLCSRKQEIPAWTKRLAWTSLAATGAGLVMSGSRGAWLGAAVAICIVTVLHGRQGQIILLIGILVVALASVLGGLSLLPDQIVDRVTGFIPMISGLQRGAQLSSIEVTDANYANVERLAFWQAATDMWTARPWVGVGIGNYQATYAQYSLPKWRMSLGHAHNYYLNIAAETGLLGLLSYLALWAAVAWNLAKTALRPPSLYTKALALGALGVVVHASVHNVVDNLWVHHLYIHVGLVLGLVQAQFTLKPQAA